VPHASVEQALSSLPLFAPLPRDELRKLGETTETRRLAPGSVLAEAGTRATHIFVITGGYVKLQVPRGSGTQSDTVDVLGPGAAFGETAITGVGHYPASALALDEVEVLAISGEAVRGYLADNLDMVFSMFASLSGSLRSLLSQVTELKLKTAAQRLGMFLLQLSNTDHGQAEVKLPYSKRIVAEKLGMTPETLSRVFAKLEPMGVHTEGRTKVLIDNVEALADYCGFEGED